MTPTSAPRVRLSDSDAGNFLSPVIVVLAGYTKQFKDSNFNVLKASFLGITTLLEAAHAAGGAKGSRAALSTVVAPAVEKLGDRKLQVTIAFHVQDRYFLRAGSFFFSHPFSFFPCPRFAKGFCYHNFLTSFLLHRLCVLPFRQETTSSLLTSASESLGPSWVSRRYW